MGEREVAKLDTRHAIGMRMPRNARLLAGERPGEARRCDAGMTRAIGRVALHESIVASNRRYVSGKMPRAGHKLYEVLVQFAECQSIGCDEAGNV